MFLVVAESFPNRNQSNS